MLTSCISDAQVVYSEFYDSNNNWVVVYMDNIPYYRLWEEYHWIYRPVPRERIPYIRINPRYHERHDLYRPRPMQPQHDMRPPKMNNQHPPITNQRPPIMNQPNSRPQMNRGGNIPQNRGGNTNRGNQGHRGGGRR